MGLVPLTELSLSDPRRRDREGGYEVVELDGGSDTRCPNRDSGSCWKGDPEGALDLRLFGLAGPSPLFMMLFACNSSSRAARRNRSLLSSLLFSSCCSDCDGAWNVLSRPSSARKVVSWSLYDVRRDAISVLLR